MVALSKKIKVAQKASTKKESSLYSKMFSKPISDDVSNNAAGEILKGTFSLDHSRVR